MSATICQHTGQGGLGKAWTSPRAADHRPEPCLQLEVSLAQLILPKRPSGRVQGPRGPPAREASAAGLQEKQVGSPSPTLILTPAQDGRDITWLPVGQWVMCSFACLIFISRTSLGWQRNPGAWGPTPACLCQGTPRGEKVPARPISSLCYRGQTGHLSETLSFLVCK